MSIAYSPTINTGAPSVSHLCHKNSTFWSPSTFPSCKTPLDYADSHSQVMASVTDLHIVQYDQAWAKDGHVLLRYTAEGSHNGKPYMGIERSEPPKRARWSAAAIFEIGDGRIRRFVKDWDQKVMQVSAAFVWFAWGMGRLLTFVDTAWLGACGGEPGSEVE